MDGMVLEKIELEWSNTDPETSISYAFSYIISMIKMI